MWITSRNFLTKCDFFITSIGIKCSVSNCSHQSFETYIFSRRKLRCFCIVSISQFLQTWCPLQFSCCMYHIRNSLIFRQINANTKHATSAYLRPVLLAGPAWSAWLQNSVWSGDFRLQVFFMNQFSLSLWISHWGRFKYFQNFANLQAEKL
jgi:hypothetical protein